MHVHCHVFNYSDFNEQEDFIYQLKQEKQKLKDGKHECGSQTVTVQFKLMASNRRS